MTIVGAFGLARKLATVRVTNVKIEDPADAANLLMNEFRHAKQESFIGIYLDSKNRVLSIKRLFKGTLDASIASPREVFGEALSFGALRVICAHNHPSGDSTPTSVDIEMTKILLEAGRVLDVDFLDHIIIGDGCFTSLRKTGLVEWDN